MTATGLQAHVDALAELCRHSSTTVAVAESLTCGAIVSAIGAGKNAGNWLRGGVVAYSVDVKRSVLGVTAEQLVSEECARELAMGVRRLLGADAAVSSTGVGGPGSEEGQPPGTVHLAAAWDGGAITESTWFSGTPEEVLEQTVIAALALLEKAIRMRADGPSAGM